MAPGAGERLLGDLLGHGRVADHRHREPEHARLKAAHERGRGAAITGGEPGDQRFIGYGEHMMRLYGIRPWRIAGRLF